MSTNWIRQVGTLASIALLSASLTACGDDGAEDARGSDDPGAPTVVATTGIAADIVAEVAGDQLRVLQLVPDGGNPHSYAPSAKQQKELADAELLVLFSPQLEEALPLGVAPQSFAIAEHIEGSDEAGAHEQGEDEHAQEGGQDEHAQAEDGGDEHAHERGSADPHVWMDPTRIEAALPDLAMALGELAPEHAADFSRRATQYTAELDRLDRELRTLAERVPQGRRKLVTSHDLMGYFADRYGYEVIGAPFGISPEAEASAAKVAGLIDDVEAAGVPAVFAQTGDDPEVLRRIADEAGVAVVDDLLVESLGEDADSYVEMLRATGTRISDALAG
jgi:zinc/manganese transport system substrate-binding protein